MYGMYVLWVVYYKHFAVWQFPRRVNSHFGWQIVFVEVEYAKTKGRAVLEVGIFSGDREFPQKPFHDLMVYLHRVSVRDYFLMTESPPQNSPHP
jgi:hypothetical protein